MVLLTPCSASSTTLDWVHGLQPEDLEKFLAEKKEQRMRVLCLDLEPTGIPQQVRDVCVLANIVCLTLTCCPPPSSVCVIVGVWFYHVMPQGCFCVFFSQLSVNV